MFRREVAVILVVLLLAAPGCATLVTPGNDRPVRVQSVPAGADVYVNDDHRGKTPLTVSVSRRDSHRIRIEKEGFEPYASEVRPRLNGWVFGNLLFGGLVGLVIDAVSGATKSPSPGRFQVFMQDVGEAYTRESQKAAKMPSKDDDKAARRRR